VIVSWPGSGGAISTANGTNCLNITPLTGDLFFRLRNPLWIALRDAKIFTDASFDLVYLHPLFNPNPFVKMQREMKLEKQAEMV
jgi:hypothetical protein